MIFRDNNFALRPLRFKIVLLYDLVGFEESPPRAMAEDIIPPGSLCRTFPDVLGAIILNPKTVVFVSTSNPVEGDP